MRAAEQARLKAEAEAKKLAEEQAKLREKLAAAAHAKQAPMVVSNAPSAAPDSAKRNIAPAIGPSDIARLLKLHLNRVGCDPGAIDGQWTKQSQRALRQFNKRAHTSLDVKVASLNALDVVKQHKDSVCPLEFRMSYKAEGDRCVAVACRHGYLRNKNGDCERKIRSAGSSVRRKTAAPVAKPQKNCTTHDPGALQSFQWNCPW